MQKFVEVEQIEEVIVYKDIEVNKPEEVVVEVPKIEYVDKIVEVPRIRTVQKFVEVPQVQYVDKIVDVPRIIMKEKLIEVPREVHTFVDEERQVFLLILSLVCLSRVLFSASTLNFNN